MKIQETLEEKESLLFVVGVSLFKFVLFVLLLGLTFSAVGRQIKIGLALLLKLCY